MEQSQKKKRLRPVVVCTHCRKRKIKCDKQLPCSNCVKVNLGDSCTYDSQLDRKPGDEFQMEMQMPLTKEFRSTSGPGEGYVGLFTLDKGPIAKKRRNDVNQHNGTGVGVPPLDPLNYSLHLAQLSAQGQASISSEFSGNRSLVEQLAQIGRVPSNDQNGFNSQSVQKGSPIGQGSMNGHIALNGLVAQNGGPVTLNEPNVPNVPVGRNSGSSLSNGMVEKKELEFLKERLHQIEQSLLGSAPRDHHTSVSLNSSIDLIRSNTRLLPQPLSRTSQNGTPHSAMQIPLVPQPVTIPTSQGPIFPDLGSSVSSSLSLAPSQMPPPMFSQFSYQYSGSIAGDKAALPPLRNSMLPPLNAQVKYETDLAHSSVPSSSANSASSATSATSAVPSTSSSELTRSPFSVNSNGNRNSSSNSSTPKSQCLTSEDFLIGTNIYHHPTDTINFYEKYSSVHYKDPLRRISFGPFAWSSLMRRDNGLRLIWDHIIEQKGKTASKDENTALMFAQHSADITQETTNTILSADKFTDQLEKQFQKRALQTDGYDDLIPYNSILMARRERNIQKQNLNRTTLPLGLTFYDGQIDRELQLIEKIQVVLPKRRVVWKLIYRYFSVVYTYMPFLDEEYFRRDVARIIGPSSLEDEPIKDLKIEKKLDLATVGILLIVLRLSYLSLFSNNSLLNEEILNSNDPSHEVQGPKYLMNNPININTIEVAQLCLDQFHVFRRTNFTVLQLALYIRLYHTYAPEDGDGADGGDSQVLNAVLIQMAYSLGLNREPDEQCKDLKINNLSRKIWHYLVMSDINLAYSFGNPMATDSIYSDTGLPTYVPGGENIIDKDRDRLINERFASCQFLFPALRGLVKLCLNIKSRVPLPELCSSLSQIEVEWHSRCGTLKDCLTCAGKGEPFAVERNMKVKIYLAFKAFLLSIYFHLSLHYEAKNSDLAFFYLKKCLLITTSDIMPHYSALLGQSEVISDMFINPNLEVAVHKSNMIYLSAMVRVNFMIFNMRQNAEHGRLCKEDKKYLAYFQLLCQVSSCLTRAAEYTISAISKISNRYYYAWRIAKGQTFLLKTITSNDFYEANFHNAYLLYSLKYSSEQLEEIVKLCEATLSKYRHSEFCTYGFSKQAEKFFNCGYTPDSVRSEGLTASTGATSKAADPEIDKLWLQVLSMKHDLLLAGNFQDGHVDAKTPMPPPSVGPNEGLYELPRQSIVGFDLNTPGGAPNNVDRVGYDIEMSNKFDMFSDLPFDQMFNF